MDKLIKTRQEIKLNPQNGYPYQMTAAVWYGRLPGWD
jgi:hypothetical protein